eukprot:14650310-Alexandrium_andersonii.AAC.1
MHLDSALPYRWAAASTSGRSTCALEKLQQAYDAVQLATREVGKMARTLGRSFMSWAVTHSVRQPSTLAFRQPSGKAGDHAGAHFKQPRASTSR